MLYSEYNLKTHFWPILLFISKNICIDIFYPDSRIKVGLVVNGDFYSLLNCKWLWFVRWPKELETVARLVSVQSGIAIVIQTYLPTYILLCFSCSLGLSGNRLFHYNGDGKGRKQST